MKWRERLFWGVAFLLLVLFFRACGEGCRIFRGKKPTQDTISVKIDTIYVQSKTDTFYQPIPKIKYQYITRNTVDTLTEFEVRIDPVDTAAILAEYYSTYIYSDSIPVKYGHIKIKDTVTKNKIQGRSVALDQHLPVITKTVTLTQPKRTVGYIGFSGLGNGKDPIYSIGADLSLKLKNDKIFGVGIQYGRDNTVFYQGRFALPIRLRR